MFSETTKCGKAFYSKETKKAIPYIMHFGKWYQTIVGKYSTVKVMCDNSPSWSRSAMIDGFRRVEEISASNNKFVYQVYSKEEIKLDRTKKDAVIMHFPSISNEKKPYIIIVPGGGYTCVCALAEGFPTADSFNKLGYTAFVFNYRINKKPLMPHPISDLAKAVQYIDDHADEFNVLKGQYIVCGFSAGGNLINLFCSEKIGYKNYNIPKPIAAFPIYAGCDFVDHDLDDKTSKGMFERFYGYNYKEKNLDDYLISKNASSFPPSYIVYCSDDHTVSPKASHYLGEVLEKENIPVQFEIGEKGEHGFGNGKGTSVESWCERAIEFLNNL